MNDAEGPGGGEPTGVRTHVTGARVLVAVSYGFSVRYLLPTGALDRMASVCHPVVGLGWDDEHLAELLRGRGFEVCRLPDARLDHGYRKYRRQLAIVHQRRLASPTSSIQRAQRTSTNTNQRARTISAVRRWRDQVVARRPGGARALLAAEADRIETGTNVADFRKFVRLHDFDAVVSLTPYHEQDGLLLWAAREERVPSLTSVISFDNPTTRERLIVRSDRIAVWNRYNVDELRRAYPELRPDQVGVIGAPQFDLHRRDDLVLDPDEWRRRFGLPPSRPVILYGAGPGEALPGEARLVEMIDRAIGDGRIPGNPYLLVRRHPNDPPEPWQELGRRLRHGVVAEPWAPGSTPFRGWPTDDDLALQMSSLAHSAVHVNVCSSMTVDGAMFDRPQVGPTFIPGASTAENRRVAAFSRQEHWLPIARSGGLATASDEESLIEAIGRGLERPDEFHDGRRRIISEILTFDDGRSSQRLADEVAALLARSGAAGVAAGR